jgi:Mycothiol maleylpyruvate isomerase N-terminal domain
VQGDLDVRAVVLEAGAALAAVVGALDVQQLDEPATDAWTLRELVAHATRGLLTIETTVAAPIDPSSRELGSAQGYFAVALSVPTVHAGIEQRARDAAVDVRDPHDYVLDALARVSPIVERTPLDREVQHLIGRLCFDQYLVTRIVELTLHSADIQLAAGEPVAFPDAPSAITRDALVGLVGRTDALAVACALAGRAGPRCNVLG